MRKRYSAVCLLGALAVLNGCSASEPTKATQTTPKSGTASFNQPFQVMANGRAITVGTGLAAPAYADMDGDTIPDLIVGQFAGGKARIYKT